MERDRREASSISVGVACGENRLIDIWALSNETQGTFEELPHKGDAQCAVRTLKRNFSAMKK